MFAAAHLGGYKWLDDLKRGVTFIDGIAQYGQSGNYRRAALSDRS